jgi:hypothetical protein
LKDLSLFFLPFPLFCLGNFFEIKEREREKAGRIRGEKKEKRER